jgi:hypothetical protein
MSKYFSKTMGGCAIHYDESLESFSLRFALARRGEDEGLVLKRFYAENPNLTGAQVVSLFAVGEAPRKDLVTKASLLAALPLVRGSIDKDSSSGRAWLSLCQAFGIELLPREPEPTPAVKSKIKRLREAA